MENVFVPADGRQDGSNSVAGLDPFHIALLSPDSISPFFFEKGHQVAEDQPLLKAQKVMASKCTFDGGKKKVPTFGPQWK